MRTILHVLLATERHMWRTTRGGRVGAPWAHVQASSEEVRELCGVWSTPEVRRLCLTVCAYGYMTAKNHGEGVRTADDNPGDSAESLTQGSIVERGQ